MNARTQVIGTTISIALIGLQSRSRNQIFAFLITFLALLTPVSVQAQSNPFPEIIKQVPGKVLKGIIDKELRKQNRRARNKGGKLVVSAKKIQAALAKKGYDPGPIDGRPGAKTAAAIRAFQKDHGLRATGKLTRRGFMLLTNAAGSQVRPQDFANKAPLPEAEVSHWDHNGSEMKLEVSEHRYRFSYVQPRDSLTGACISSGDVLLIGERNGDKLKGTARVFSCKCGRAQFPVRGRIATHGNKIVLNGRVPRRGSNCRPKGFRQEKLIFSRLEQEDEAQVAEAHVTNDQQLDPRQPSEALQTSNNPVENIESLPVSIKPQCKTYYEQFVEKPGFAAFAITSAGGCGSGWNYGSLKEARGGAIENCQKYNSGEDCRIAAIIHRQKWAISEKCKDELQRWEQGRGAAAFAISEYGLCAWSNASKNLIAAKKGARKRCRKSGQKCRIIRTKTRSGRIVSYDPVSANDKIANASSSATSKPPAKNNAQPKASKSDKARLKTDSGLNPFGVPIFKGRHVVADRYALNDQRQVWAPSLRSSRTQTLQLATAWETTLANLGSKAKNFGTDFDNRMTQRRVFRAVGELLPIPNQRNLLQHLGYSKKRIKVFNSYVKKGSKNAFYYAVSVPSRERHTPDSEIARKISSVLKEVSDSAVNSPLEFMEIRRVSLKGYDSAKKSVVFKIDKENDWVSRGWETFISGRQLPFKMIDRHFQISKIDSGALLASDNRYYIITQGQISKEYKITIDDISIYEDPNLEKIIHRIDLENKEKDMISRARGKDKKHPKGRQAEIIRDSNGVLSLPEGEWHGTYKCQQRLTGVSVKLVVSSNKEYEGYFKFYPTTQEQSVPSGTFVAAATFDRETRQLRLTPKKWIRTPPGYSMVGVRGQFSKDLSSFRGKITARGCSSIALSKDKPQPHGRQTKIAESSGETPSTREPSTKSSNTDSSDLRATRPTKAQAANEKAQEQLAVRPEEKPLTTETRPDEPQLAAKATSTRGRTVETPRSRQVDYPPPPEDTYLLEAGFGFRHYIKKGLNCKNVEIITHALFDIDKKAMYYILGAVDPVIRTWCRLDIDDDPLVFRSVYYVGTEKAYELALKIDRKSDPSFRYLEFEAAAKPASGSQAFVQYWQDNREPYRSTWTENRKPFRLTKANLVTLTGEAARDFRLAMYVDVVNSDGYINDVGFRRHVPFNQHKKGEGFLFENAKEFNKLVDEGHILALIVRGKTLSYLSDYVLRVGYPVNGNLLRGMFLKREQQEQRRVLQLIELLAEKRYFHAVKIKEFLDAQGLTIAAIDGDVSNVRLTADAAIDAMQKRFTMDKCSSFPFVFDQRGMKSSRVSFIASATIVFSEGINGIAMCGFGLSSAPINLWVEGIRLSNCTQDAGRWTCVVTTKFGCKMETPESYLDSEGSRKRNQAFDNLGCGFLEAMQPVSNWRFSPGAKFGEWTAAPITKGR